MSETINETEDFEISENENGEEILIEKEHIENKNLGDLLFECLSMEDTIDNCYLYHPENPNYLIIFEDGGVFVSNEENDTYISLTECQVIFVCLKVPARNFWDFGCLGYEIKNKQ